MESDSGISHKLVENIIERYLFVNLPYYKRCVWVCGRPSEEKKNNAIEVLPVNFHTNKVVLCVNFSITDIVVIFEDCDIK